jgi:16S rRNA (cytosine967-C5)-methyltransferase
MYLDTHILAFFKQWRESNKPLDLSLSQYFRAHKNLGSHDRRYIGDTVYALVRWESLFAWLSPDGSMSERLHLYKKQPIEAWLKTANLPAHAAQGTTPYLLESLQKAYGPNKAEELARVFNTPAPVAIRTNLAKISRDALLEKLAPRFEISKSPHAPAALVFAKREPLFALPEFKEGLFEMQDEGSQIIADLIQTAPKERVLDFCSGSGGKSLAIAHKMEGKGELYLHDVRPRALEEAKLRLRRAGVQNAQILLKGHPTLKKLKGKMDWVIVDAPCSGTGTLRRNPDMKWKIDSPMIKRLVEEQRSIFSEALSYVKPGGKILYITCSLLPEENEEQIEFLLKTYPLSIETPSLKLLPTMNGPDGFFAAVFRK